MNRAVLRLVSVASGILMIGLLLVALNLLHLPLQGSGKGNDATPVSAAVAQCGGSLNDVAAELDLPNGRGFWQMFPSARRAPELESDTNPIHVVVFRGSFNTGDLAMGGAPGFEQPKELDDVVCVIRHDGSMDLYFNVSRVGSQFAD